MQCHQCEKRALFLVGVNDISSVPLCLDCSIKLKHADTARLNTLLKLNDLAERNLDLALGISMQPVINNKIIQQENLTMNNINIKNSTVGVINTGNIHSKSIDISVKSLEKSDQKEIADILKLLHSAILNVENIENKNREILLEHVSFISEEAVKPKSQRKKSVIINSIEKIGAFASLAESLKNIWEFSHPMLHSLAS